MAKNDHFASTYTLKPNTTYTVNNATYTTDQNGNITKFNGPSTDQSAPRSPSHQQNLPGKEPGDHASHLIAASNGGSGKVDGKVNTRDYRAMERENNDLIRDGKQVTLSGELTYSDGSNRPNAIMVDRTTIDPATGKEDVEHMSWTNTDMSQFENDGTWAGLAEEYDNSGATIVDDQSNVVSSAQDDFHNDMVAAADGTLSEDADDGLDDGLGQDDGQEE